jgi:hypothetical protein
MQPFASRERFEAAHPNALAVYCADGRFTKAVEELLHHLGHERIDVLAVPGGPALFNMNTASFADFDSLTRGASFLIRAHAIKKVVLLAHEGCGYYASRYTGEPPERIGERQRNDLRAAAKRLAELHRGIAIGMYVARVRSDTRIEFEPVAEVGGKGAQGALA